MIPFDFITEWRTEAPWVDDAQVEQDLVFSRALVEIFRHPLLAESVALRGGTALSKLHLRPPARSTSAGRRVTCSISNSHSRTCRRTRNGSCRRSSGTWSTTAIR